MRSFPTTHPISSGSKAVLNSTHFFALYLSLILATLPLLMRSGSLQLSNLVATQTHQPWHWFFLREPLSCLIFLTAFCVFANNEKRPWTRSPLMTALHYLKAIVLAAIFVLFFLGGGLIPFVSTQSLQNHASDFLFYTLLSLSIILIVLSVLCFVKLRKDIRGDKSHTRILIEGGALLALGLIIFLVTAISGKMILSDEVSQAVAAIFQGGAFLIKIFCVCCFFAWVRITLPRMKQEHLTRLGWVVLVPLALGNVVVAGVRLCLLP